MQRDACALRCGGARDTPFLSAPKGDVGFVLFRGV
jgi:hypothetical protein